ncbi:MAG: peptidylprolyl isomerase, partial [Planctomycetota bacterium]
PGASVPAFRRDPRVRMRTTRGDFEAVLFSGDAPVHVENFLRIARVGRYSGTPFHRVEPNFVVQGGDHLGDGTGARAAEGGTIRDEINRRRFLVGTIGMPKTDVPDSGGSQIFITLVPTPHLDGRYTAFGQVDSGMEVVSAIEVGDRIEEVVVLDPGR